MRRILRIASVALITAGLVILADVGLTVAWEEPVSALYGSVQQREAESELEEVTESFQAELAPAPQTAPSPREVRARARTLADRFAGELEDGQPIGRLRAPSIDADQVVLEGTDLGTLKQGPGRYPRTALPGQGETIGIAGHRTTYGAPFRNIDGAKRGDEIELEMPYATFTYRVQGTRIVAPDAVEVVRDVGYERLVLTACHPLYSAAERYVVFARLVEVELADPASAS
jgi:sortase A